MTKDAGFDGVEVSFHEEGEVSVNSTEKDLLAVKKSAETNGIELYSVAGEKIEKATVCDAVASLDLLLKELNFKG